MRMLRVALLAVGLVAAKGCTGIVLTTAALTAGVGVDRMANDFAYKTFPAPIDKVRQAALKALDHLAMVVTDDGEDRKGWRIQAVTDQRTINVELEALTPDATRMRVVVHKGSIFFKDGEAGRRIIVGTTERLASQAADATVTEVGRP